MGREMNGRWLLRSPSSFDFYSPGITRKGRRARMALCFLPSDALQRLDPRCMIGECRFFYKLVVACYFAVKKAG
jgi:hypothetical protein